MNERQALCYTLGYLQATLGSLNDYSADELLEKMRHLVEYLEPLGLAPTQVQ